MAHPPLPRISLALLFALLTACSGSGDIIHHCRDGKGLHPVCGIQHPEDLAVPGAGSPLIISEAGSMLDLAQRGRISLLDLATEELRVAYPVKGGSRPSPASSAAPGWGDPACPGEPAADLNPHGIDLARLSDGRLRLLVVNHGGRESIEFFEVTGSGRDLALHWRGCAIPPDGLFFNDVVNLPEGGFLATHMLTGNPIWGILRSRMGVDTGAVYEWQAPEAWTVVPGTEAPFPNGIEISDDAREIFLNVYSAGEVWRIARATGERLAVAHLPHPDNSSWSRDGRLLVASHAGGFVDEVRCRDLESGACPMPFDIVSLDPVTLEGRVVFSNTGAPMGAATVAVDLGDEWVIGAFASDRVLRVPH